MTRGLNAPCPTTRACTLRALLSNVRVGLHPGSYATLGVSLNEGCSPTRNSHARPQRLRAAELSDGPPGWALEGRSHTTQCGGSGIDATRMTISPRHEAQCRCR